MNRAGSIAVSLLLLATILVVLPSPASAAFSGFDNFDSDTPGIAPAGDFYSYGGDDDCVTTASESDSAPNAVRLSRNNAAYDCVGLFTLQDSVCDQTAAVVEFDFNVQDVDSQLQIFILGSAPTGNVATDTAAAGWFLQISATGQVQAAAKGTGGSTGGVIPGLTVVADTWYSARMSGFGCSGSGSFRVEVIGFGASTTTNANVAGGNDKYLTSASSDAAELDTIYIDNLRVTAQLVFTPTATVCQQAGPCGNTVTGWTQSLTGFDVDKFGNVVIARTDTSGNIRSFHPLSLVQIGASPADSDCNRADGVVGYSQYPQGKFYSAYLGCHTSPTDVDTLHIRNGDLNPPDFAGTVCEGENFCQSDPENVPGDIETGTNPGTGCNQSSVTGSDSDDLPPDSGQMGNVVSVPISHTTGSTPEGFTFAKRVYVGYAYSNTVSSNIGFWVAKLVNNNDDLSCAYEVPFAPAGTIVNQICSFRYLNQTVNPRGDFVGAVSGTLNGKFWTMFVDNLDNSPDASNFEVPRLRMEAVGPTLPASGIDGMGCSSTNDVLTIDATGKVERWHILPGSDYTQPTYVNGIPEYHEDVIPGTKAWTITGNGYNAPSRGIKMDDTGRWGAYHSSATTITIINATSGTAVATATLPSGTYVDMAITRNGQNLYVATTTHIARYEIITATTGDPLCPVCNPDGTTQNSDGTNSGDTETPPSDGGTGGSLVGALTPFFGNLGSIGNLVMGILIILAFLGIGVAVMRKRQEA